MPVSLLFATHNSHKVSEVAQITGGSVEIVSLDDAGYRDLVIEETRDTFEGNAAQKAEGVYAITARDCFSEDSGLEVDALGGQPGVYTARYAGHGASAKQNIDKLLHALSQSENRRARFKTVIALILDGTTHYFHGSVEGLIAREPSGDEGFGYDPIFIPEGYDQTFAELPSTVKNSLSHRAKAVHAMMQFLENNR